MGLSEHVQKYGEWSYNILLFLMVYGRAGMKDFRIRD